MSDMKNAIEYINNTKVIKCIENGAIPFNVVSPITTMKLNKSPINTFISLEVNSDYQIEQENISISRFDKAVLDVIYSLWIHGIETFRIEDVIRLLSGNKKQDVTVENKNAVTKSIKKMLFIRITIDCSEEFLARKIDDEILGVEIEGPLLPLTRKTIYYRNREVTAYSIESIPLLYRYAGKVKQIIAIPAEILDTHEFLQDTSETIILKRYLIQRIEEMKCQRNHIVSRRIALEYKNGCGEEKGLYEALGYHKEDFKNWRDKKAKLNRSIQQLLDAFTKKKYILDYKTIKKDCSIYAYEIVF